MTRSPPCPSIQITSSGRNLPHGYLNARQYCTGSEFGEFMVPVLDLRSYPTGTVPAATK